MMTTANEIQISEPVEQASGILQIHEKGFGFLRKAANNYLPRPKDIFVARNLIQKLKLREGVHLVGAVKMTETSRGQSDALIEVETINGLTVDEYARVKDFNQLTSIDPTERLELSEGNNNLSMRVIDLVAPIGKGQRGLIVAPPKTGKTTLIEEIAESVANNHPEVHLVVLLIDERPEEVTHFKRRVRGEVIASSSDQHNDLHLQVAKLMLERVKRLVECGQDVVMLLDSLTRLARASNRDASRRGRTMSGGVDSRALEFPRKFFGAARNAEEGGSLTIVATALIDTGSQMDEVIFQEFKGTGNLEIVLDRRLAEKRIFPAIDISKSGTRKEEKLFDAATLPKIHLLRRALADKRPTEAMELLLNKLQQTANNREFFESMK
ncbi:MAG: transcription termination factor Rho [Acidobacteriota bacterium]